MYICPPVERQKAAMDVEHIKNYLAQAKSYAERICFHVMGEPLGHSSFPEFVKIAEEMGIPLEITTNGTLLNERNQVALLNKTVVQVNFSVQSFFDNFPQADSSNYIDRLLYFTSKAKQEHDNLYINFRLWNLSNDQQDSIQNEQFLRRLEEFFTVKINRNVDPAFQKSKRLQGRIYLHFDSRFDWPDATAKHIRTKGTCYGTRTHIAVHANGTVVPCCLDKEANIPLGNLNHTNLEEILASDRYLNMKKGFEEGILAEDFCQKCSFAMRFD